VDEIVSVTENEIREATRALSGNSKTVAEPSGAVAVAAFMFHSAELPRTAYNVAVISGGNIEPQLLAELRKA
jgi:threonine dehydratase